MEQVFFVFYLHHLSVPSWFQSLLHSMCKYISKFSQTLCNKHVFERILLVLAKFKSLVTISSNHIVCCKSLTLLPCKIMFTGSEKLKKSLVLEWKWHQHHQFQFIRVSIQAQNFISIYWGSPKFHHVSNLKLTYIHAS